MDRNRALDGLRLISAVAVVMLHVAAYHTLDYQVLEKGFGLGVFLNSLTRFSVPVFIMLSGAGMLAKDRDLKEILRRALKLFVYMVLGAGVYLVLHARNDLSSLGLGDLKRLFTEPLSFWYFYTAAGLYLLTPLLQPLSKEKNQRRLRYVIGVLFGLGWLGFFIQYFYPEGGEILHRGNLPVNWIFIAYYLWGRYILDFPPQKKARRVYYLLGVAGWLVSFLGTLYLSRLDGEPNWAFFSFFAPNVTLFAMGVLVFFASRSWTADWLTPLASLTLGIYMFHGLGMGFCRKVFPPMGILAQVVLETVVTTLGTGIVVFLGKKLMASLKRLVKAG